MEKHLQVWALRFSEISDENLVTMTTKLFACFKGSFIWSLCHIGCTMLRGRIQDFLKGGNPLYKGVGVRFADFISIFLNIP